MAATAPAGPRAIDQYIDRNGIKCVLYGAAGIGKTRSILTAPRPLYISAEKGARSLKGSDVTGWEISTLAQLNDVSAWLFSSNEAKNFDTVMLDSISELAENILKLAKQNVRDGRLAHANATELVIFEVLNKWRDMPQKHVIMIARERYDENAATNVRQYKPSMPNGNMMQILPYKFDYLFRMFGWQDPVTQQFIRAFQCTGNTQAEAKDRSGRLQQYEQPDFAAVFAKSMQ